MLLEKSSEKWLLFSVTVSLKAVTLRYNQSNSETSQAITFRTEGRLPLDEWTHLTLQVKILSKLCIIIVTLKCNDLLNLGMWNQAS